MRMSEVLQRLRAEQADRRATPPPDAAVRAVPAGDRRDAAAVAGRGRHAPGPRPQPGSRDGLPQPVPQAGGHATRPARSRTGAWSWRSPRRSRRAPAPSSAPRPATRRRPPPPTAPRPAWRSSSSCPQGKIAAGKLLQAQVAGARVVAIDGDFDEALRVVRELDRAPRPGPPGDARQLRQPVPARRARRRPRSRSARTSAARPTTSPSRSATPATSAPTGWASRTTAPRAWSRPLPVMLGFQAAGAAPLVLGHRVEPPGDRRHGHPHRRSGERRQGARGARRVRRPHRRGDRRARSWTPTATWRAARASSASRPAPRRWRASASSPPRAPSTRAATIVCVLTGHGLKDPDTAASLAQPVIPAPADTAAVRAALGW